MLNLHSLGIFISAGLLLNLVPGPDVLYIVARSTSQGRAAGIISVLGISTGCLFHTMAAACGLSALLVAIPAAYSAIKTIGAAYLVYLGFRAIFSKGTPVAFKKVPPAALKQIYLQGVLTNVLNPKVALFFLAFLPQFTDPNAGSVSLQFVALGMIFIFNGTIVCVGYALLASRLGDWLRSHHGLSKALDRITGGVFIALGLRLAFSGRK